MSKKLWNWPGDLYYMLFIGVIIFLLELFNRGSGWLESALLALVVIALALPGMVALRWVVRKLWYGGAS